MTMTPLAPSAPSINGATQGDYLRSRWDDALASRMDPVERLIYRSNILGADARITNTGGGNIAVQPTAEPCPPWLLDDESSAERRAAGYA